MDAEHVIRTRVADVFSQVLGASSGEDQAEALKAVVTEENASTLASLVYFVDVDLARPGFDIPVARAILRAMHPGTRTLCRFIANQTEANYAGAEIGAGGALLLARDLQHGPASSSLDSIVLSDNDLGKDGAVAISEALNVNASLTKLKLANFELPIDVLKTAAEVNLRNKKLTDLDAIVIATCMNVNASMKSLK